MSQQLPLKKKKAIIGEKRKMKKKGIPGETTDLDLVGVARFAVERGI